MAMPAMLLKLFYFAKTCKNIKKTLQKESRNGAQPRWPEALKVWQALGFREIWRKWETRNKKNSEVSGIPAELTNLAEFLHPLLPDPPPFLLKHVTKTSIAVPALPVIHLGTSDPAFLPTLQGQVDCLLVGPHSRLGPRAPGIHEIHTILPTLQGRVTVC